MPNNSVSSNLLFRALEHPATHIVATIIALGGVVWLASSHISLQLTQVKLETKVDALDPKVIDKLSNRLEDLESVEQKQRVQIEQIIAEVGVLNQKVDHMTSRMLALERANPDRDLGCPNRKGTQAGLPGQYRVTGTNPNGSRYLGTASINRRADGSYQVAWMVRSDKFSGVGRFEDGVLTVDWGKDAPATYTLKETGTLMGTWAHGKGAETLFPRAATGC